MAVAKKQTSIKVDPQLWDKLKIRAIERKTTQSKLMEEYIKKGLDNDKD